MRSNETTSFWISIVAAVAAVFLLYQYSQEKKSELDKKFGSLTRVVVAAKDIAEMETIEDTMLDFKNVPEEYVTPGYATTKDSIVGQVTASPIKAGEPLLTNKLLQPGPDSGIALQVPIKKRALTLPIDEIRGVAKLLHPGDRVDIYAALDIGKGINARREVSLILQDVPIMATGLNVVNNIPRIFESDNSGKSTYQISLVGDTKFNTITIEANPQQASDLIYILSTQPQNLFLTLRNPNDREQIRTTASTAESVSGKPIVDSPSSTPGFAPPKPGGPGGPSGGGSGR